MKRVIIAGGSGHIGSSLVNKLAKEGYDVTILTRRVVDSQHPSLRYIHWDGITVGPWTKYVDESDIVINLCGKSVDCRYTKSNKLKLIHSRVMSTQLLGNAIKNSLAPPKIWINASSSAYYGFSTEIMDESAAPGNDFPARICVEWEKAFAASQTPTTRKIAWRLGVVLQRNKGFLQPFVRLVKSFLGGKLGSGRQYFTWIHEEDFLNAALWTIENPLANGAYNITSPEPVCNAQFMEALRKAVGVRTGFSLGERAIQMGGMLIGTEPYLILEGRRIIPKRLVDSGFKFQYPEIQNALNDLFKTNGQWNMTQSL